MIYASHVSHLCFSFHLCASPCTVASSHVMVFWLALLNLLVVDFGCYPCLHSFNWVCPLRWCCELFCNVVLFVTWCWLRNESGLFNVYCHLDLRSQIEFLYLYVLALPAPIICAVVFALYAFCCLYSFSAFVAVWLRWPHQFASRSPSSLVFT